jgi:hypothetical protein
MQTHGVRQTTAEPVFEHSIAKQLVRRQMNHGGNVLMSGLEPLTDDEFFAGGPNGISAAWTVGHLACVFDLFTSWLSGRELVLARSVHNVFNPLELRKASTSKAESVDRLVHAKPDVLLMFRERQVGALAELDAFDMDRWEEPTPHYVPDTMPTYGSIWQHLGVHTFWHLGELAGCLSRFHGTYTLNTVVHYFYTRSESGTHPVARQIREPESR